jgi:hypothetical protein
MSNRDGGFFRGSELPRLLFLLGLLVVGAALVFRLLAGQAARDARPAPRVVEREPLPPPDNSLELSGVVDREPLNPRENPGYLSLLERVRSTPPDQLARDARRDVVFSQLINNPSRYRGLPIRVEGTLLRVLEQSSTGSKLFPRGQFYEGWAVTPDSQGYPWILVFEDPPGGLPVGDDLRAYFTFEGYFFKLMAYVAGDTTRFAPLLVGRLRSVDAGSSAPLPSDSLPIPWWAPILGLLGFYGLVRWFSYARRLTRRESVSRRYFSTVNDQIDPEQLSDWLNSVSDSQVVNNESTALPAIDPDPPSPGHPST